MKCKDCMIQDRMVGRSRCKACYNAFRNLAPHNSCRECGTTCGKRTTICDSCRASEKDRKALGAEWAVLSRSLSRNAATVLPVKRHAWFGG